MDNNNRTPVYSCCPYCGAQQEIDPAQDIAYCRYCGKPSPVSKTIGGIQERRQTLPRLDGESIPVFPRESDSYYTEPQKTKKRHIFWWIVGWIFCFPIPLTILMLRNRKFPTAARIAIIVLGWIVYLALGLRGRANQTTRTPSVPSIPAVVETTATPRPTTRPTATPKPTATPEPEEEAELEEEAVPVEEPAEEEPSFSDGVTPEFKEAMDSYEAFFDEYCDFMQTMAEDPTDMTVLLRYADFMSQYADTMEKLDAIDETELSPADDAYYIEVMARINVKLLEAANYMQ